MCCRLCSDERALVLGAKQLGFVFHTRLPERVTITVVSVLAGIQYMQKMWTFALGVFCCCTVCMDRLPTELKLLHAASLKRHNESFLFSVVYSYECLIKLLFCCRECTAGVFCIVLYITLWTSAAEQCCSHVFGCLSRSNTIHCCGL